MPRNSRLYEALLASVIRAQMTGVRFSPGKLLQLLHEDGYRAHRTTVRRLIRQLEEDYHIAKTGFVDSYRGKRSPEYVATLEGMLHNLSAYDWKLAQLRFRREQLSRSLTMQHEPVFA